MTCPKTLYVISSLVRISPDKAEPEYGALKESINRRGLLDPILMWRGTVVDGYHRLRACLELERYQVRIGTPDRGSAVLLRYVTGE